MWKLRVVFLLYPLAPRSELLPRKTIVSKIIHNNEWHVYWSHLQFCLLPVKYDTQRVTPTHSELDIVSVCLCNPTGGNSPESLQPRQIALISSDLPCLHQQKKFFFLWVYKYFPFSFPLGTTNLEQTYVRSQILLSEIIWYGESLWRFGLPLKWKVNVTSWNLFKKWSKQSQHSHIEYAQYLEGFLCPACWQVTRKFKISYYTKILSLNWRSVCLLVNKRAGPIQSIL